MTRNPQNDLKTDHLIHPPNMLLDNNGESAVSRIDTQTDTFRNKTNSTVKSRINETKPTSDLSRIISDKLNKRYSSKKRPTQARNATNQPRDYNYNLPLHAVSSGTVQ